MTIRKVTLGIALLSFYLNNCCSFQRQDIGALSPTSRGIIAEAKKDFACIAKTAKGSPEECEKQKASLKIVTAGLTLVQLTHLMITPPTSNPIAIPKATRPMPQSASAPCSLQSDLSELTAGSSVANSPTANLYCYSPLSPAPFTFDPLANPPKQPLLAHMNY